MFAAALLDSLKIANLLPSAIIPTNFTPVLDLGVTFPSGLAPHYGSLARVSQVKQQPKISISNPPATTSNLTYTFMMIDPDAPTPDDPKFDYWRHWVVTSIRSPSVTTSADDITASGTTLTQYLAPGPKDESGPHRYLFLLFEEKEGGLEKSDVGGEEFVDRRSFRAEEVVERRGMRLAGVQWMRGVGDGWKECKGEL